MKIREYSPEEFDNIEHYWKKLESGKDMTIFQSYDWYKWLNSYYSKEKTKKLFRSWRYVVCENEGKVMIAPLQIVNIGFSIKSVGVARGIYFIGRVGYTDYLKYLYFRRIALQ